MRRLRALLPLLLAALPAPAPAQEAPVVVVTPGSARSYRAAIQQFADESTLPDARRAPRLRDQIVAALEFSDVFAALSPQAFLGPLQSRPLAEEAVVCSDWTPIGADAVVEGTIVRDEDFSVEFRIWDPVRCRALARKRYRQPGGSDEGFVARRIADDIVEAFIGRPGVASTEITFVSDRGGNPEIYVMSADGSSQRAATANGSINNFPSWAPEGDGIVYTSYRYENRPLLFLSSRGRGRPGRLLSRLDADHAEYRGVYAPDGSRLALVMSKPGVATELYVVRPDGRGLDQLTNDRAIDIGPAWSPDGSQLAFVSDRSGTPQIYIMDLRGRKVRRLTYQGSYNTHPAWSPDGDWIAYETRVGGQFDIWLIDPEGTVNVPLVVHPLSDESPSWAPNGRKLAFSSRRRGRADIYAVDLGGQNLRRLTQGAGNNTHPSWGPLPR